jgi:deoxyribodipyrimidine photo-lyase
LKNFNLDLANNLITKDTTVFWFRRDLRLQDNAGLHHALQSGSNVLCLFIFDSVILTKLDDRKDRRITFIYQALLTIKQQLETAGSTLLILYGNPIDIFKRINPKAVFTNHDYEPYATQRDEHVRKILTAKGISFNTFKDHVIFEKNEVMKDDGTPYTIFTPYSRKWKSKFIGAHTKSYPSGKNFSSLAKVIKSTPIPAFKEIGFVETDLNPEIQKRIVKTSVIKNYHNTRNFPSIKGTTRLSVHLRFGTVSIRKLAAIAIKENETWLNELIWRDFYQMILWHFPQIETQSFKPAYDHIVWRNNEKEFNAWCEGNTGYPIVDAGMRELNTTGVMHNRVRMITASFLTKHLLIDWRWGEAYFAKKLLDYDMAANNGGWQWAAGTGCDAAPYFRVFSPDLQTVKFDPDLTYIRHWVPELDTTDYVKPIVDHKFARDRAIKTYQAVLQN